MEKKYFQKLTSWGSSQYLWIKSLNQMLKIIMKIKFSQLTSFEYTNFLVWVHVFYFSNCLTTHEYEVLIIFQVLITFDHLVVEHFYFGCKYQFITIFLYSCSCTI